MIKAPLDQPKVGAPDWMVTFADLMSLLLTFFVLLLSFSNLEVVKFATMAGSVKNALGLKSDFTISDTPTGDDLLAHKSPRDGTGKSDEARKIIEGGGLPQRELIVEIRKALEQIGVEDRARIRTDDRGVTLEIDGELLFDSGQAELRLDGLVVLDSLREIVSGVPGIVEVQGHTDNVPISTHRYPTNWELSAARAARAVRFLVDRGVSPTRLRALGNGDSRPLASNETAEGRAMNRRVEFIFTVNDSNVDVSEIERNLRNHSSSGVSK